jgi:hypothetical protein
VHHYTRRSARCYTDEWQGYRHIHRSHPMICHGRQEWARDDERIK